MACGLPVARADPVVSRGCNRQRAVRYSPRAVIALEGEDPRRIEQVCAAVEAAPETVRGFVSASVGPHRTSCAARTRGCWSRTLRCGDASPSPVAQRIGPVAGNICRGRSRTRTRCCGPGPCAPQERWQMARRDLLPVLRRQMRSEIPSLRLLGCMVGGATRRPGRRSVGVAIRRRVGHAARLARAPGGAAQPASGGGRPPIGCRRWHNIPNAGETSSSVVGSAVILSTFPGSLPGWRRRRIWHGTRTADASTPERAIWWENLSVRPVSPSAGSRESAARKAAALELTLLRPGTPLFETRAPSFRQ